MSSMTRCIRAMIAGALLTMTFVESTDAAEPKVVPASHETTKAPAARSQKAPAELPADSDESVTPEMSYSPQWPEPPNTGAMLMRLGLGTMAVLALCAGSLWFGRPWLKRLQGTNMTNPSFHVEGTVALGNRAVLYLVRVGGTQLVAGTDLSGLKSLIALPVSFKDVLEDQTPDEDLPAASFPASVDYRPATRTIVKDER